MVMIVYLLMIKEVIMSREDIRRQIQESNEENVGTSYTDPEIVDSLEIMIAKRSSRKSIGNKEEVPYNKYELSMHDLQEENKDLHNRVVKNAKTIRNYKIAARVIALLVAGVVLTGAGLKTKEYIDDQNTYDYYSSEAINILNEGRNRTADAGYYYNYDTIAKKLISDPDSFDFNLYGMYKKIHYHKLEELDKILKAYGKLVNSSYANQGLNDYDSLKDYCSKKGFQNEDGSIDCNSFEKGIEAQMRLQKEIEDLEEERERFKAK